MPRVIPDSEKTARFRAFWERAETDRPLVGATIATFPSMRAVGGEGILQPDDLDLAEGIREIEEEWAQWGPVSGDALWGANPLWAFPWHMAIAGSPIERDADILWARPALESWDQLDAIRFDPANPWQRRLMELSARVVEHARGRYAAGAGQLMLGPVDMMMQLRGQERLALDLHDTPEMVVELGRRCVDLCAAALDAQYAAMPRYLGGYAGTIRYFWAPDRIVETAEDANFMVSPTTHRRFILPLHRELGRRFPYTIVHLHSAQLHTVVNLLDVPEIAAIEITPDFGAPLLPHLPLLARVLEHKPLILHGVIPIGDLRELARRLPARGLALFARCDSPAEAAGVLDALVG